MNLRKGISPVIATVIIVAVALAIAIAAVGWVMGIWGSVTGGTEILKILPDSKLLYDNNKVKIVLHIKNEGGATAILKTVEIVGVNATSVTTNSTVGPGGETTVTLSELDWNVTPGATYTIKVYTAAGNVYSTQIVAEST